MYQTSAKQRARLVAQIEATFTDSCTVRNKTFVSDGIGGQVASDVDLTVRCRRLVDTKPKETQTAGAIQGSTQYTILLPLGTLISRASQIIQAGACYEVLNVLDHTDNLCLRVTCVRAD